MPALATRFSLLLAGLRAVIAPIAARDRARTALLVLLWTRLARMAARFDRLFTRWRAGTLPAPTTAPGRLAVARAPRPATPRLPQGRAWLLRQLPEAAATASQLQHFLADPDLAAFLADAPQLTRLLRPLAHMLGVPLPPPTPRPAPHHPPPPPPPQPPPPEPRPPAGFCWPEFFPAL